MILGILTIILPFAFTFCTRKAYFQASSIVPSAKCYVDVTRDSNNNYVIQLQIKSLVEVDKLESSDRTYVVWMITGWVITYLHKSVSV